LIFALAISFFDAVQRHKGEEHAMIRSKTAGTVWQIMHIVLGYSLFLVGVGMKSTYERVAKNEEILVHSANLIAFGCG
jgi:hypothetical protein